MDISRKLVHADTNLCLQPDCGNPDCWVRYAECNDVATEWRFWNKYSLRSDAYGLCIHLHEYTLSDLKPMIMWHCNDYHLKDRQKFEESEGALCKS